MNLARQPFYPSGPQLHAPAGSSQCEIHGKSTPGPSAREPRACRVTDGATTGTPTGEACGARARASAWVHGRLGLQHGDAREAGGRWPLELSAKWIQRCGASLWPRACAGAAPGTTSRTTDCNVPSNVKPQPSRYRSSRSIMTSTGGPTVKLSANNSEPWPR
jgi:hypothetical protein